MPNLGEKPESCNKISIKQLQNNEEKLVATTY